MYTVPNLQECIGHFIEHASKQEGPQSPFPKISNGLEHVLGVYILESWVSKSEKLEDS